MGGHANMYMICHRCPLDQTLCKVIAELLLLHLQRVGREVELGVLGTDVRVQELLHHHQTQAHPKGDNTLPSLSTHVDTGNDPD